MCKLCFVYSKYVYFKRKLRRILVSFEERIKYLFTFFYFLNEQINYPKNQSNEIFGDKINIEVVVVGKRKKNYSCFNA